MHMNRRKALGIAVPMLLGTALVVSGAAALPAHAATWQDTALSGGTVTDSAFAGTGLGAANGTGGTAGDIVLAGSGVTTWSLHGSVPTGVSLTGSTISYSGSEVASPPVIVVDATDAAGNAE